MQVPVVVRSSLLFTQVCTIHTVSLLLIIIIIIITNKLIRVTLSQLDCYMGTVLHTS